MGIYEGVPTRVCPHSTSGRADYWGPFVNRAARFGNSAAHGGQIMVPAAVACKLVLCLTGQALTLDQDGPLLVGSPDFVPTKVKLRPGAASGIQAGAGLPPRPRRFEEQRRTAEVRQPCPAACSGVQIHWERRTARLTLPGRTLHSWPGLAARSSMRQHEPREAAPPCMGSAGQQGVPRQSSASRAMQMVMAACSSQDWHSPA